MYARTARAADTSDAQRLEAYNWLDERLEQWARLVRDGQVQTKLAGSALLGQLAGEGAELERRIRAGDVSPREASHAAWASTIPATNRADADIPPDVLTLDRLVAGLHINLRAVVIAHYMLGGRVQDKAKRLHCAVSAYYRRLLTAYQQLAQHVRR